MPFDGRRYEPEIEKLERLNLLMEIAKASTGEQGSWATCLWSEVRSSATLYPAIAKFAHPRSRTPPANATRAARVFGLSSTIWDNRPLSLKRQQIARRIAILRCTLARLETVAECNAAEG